MSMCCDDMIRYHIFYVEYIFSINFLVCELHSLCMFPNLYTEQVSTNSKYMLDHHPTQDVKQSFIRIYIALKRLLFLFCQCSADFEEYTCILCIHVQYMCMSVYLYIVLV
jgi:hypothetical protein